MLYIPYFFGGLGNNLLQLNNAIELLKVNKIDLNFLKIVPKVGSRYKNRDVAFLFEGLEKHYITSNFLMQRRKRIPIKTITYNKRSKIPNINPRKSYIIYHCFHCYNPYLLYDYLNIFNKQLIIRDKYKDIIDNNTIAFHIRRGDYTYLKDYKKYVRSDSSIINIIKKYSNNKILILTNGVDYIKNITKDFKNIIYASDLNLSLGDEFLLGSVCKSVIRNRYSSFSLCMYKFNRKYHHLLKGKTIN